MRRVAITGAGTINALGHDVPSTLQALRNGVCGIGPLTIRDADRLSVRIGAQVKHYDETAHFGRQQIALYDRFTQFAVISAAQAMKQSGLSIDEELACRSGVLLGTSGGGLSTVDDSYRSVYEEGKNRVHPFVVPRLMANAAASAVSMEHGLQGPVFTVSSACASSNHAMGLAFQMIRSGMADVMLTGGSEAMLCFGGIKAWEGLRVMSEDGCRPFSATRNGMVEGEGAAVFVLEEWNHAVERGADILAEFAGFGMTADAKDIVLPSADGAQRAISAALADAGLAAEDIAYVNAHGTGTTANDRVECLALAKAFGPAADHLLVSSTKSMHGHLIGGTGAVEVLACLLALREGVIAPTIGFDATDPECPLDVVPNIAREAKVTACLSNAFAFGGLNAVVALRTA
ncbi:beta-ketoacyl-[acyl-carrier-protein] synthase family protein [Rubellimicrobium rubrum]|uniref:Nodulation protein E n=1 Tax=Rubellimicrobium rubrum TaxID=2585369 RepID=A0A5C4N2F8_9RHOB|nr:beta-ketoacyl-[acyl-carrier-protein] synthase family protein [Rubellimicrobium rubrum]TNC51111.1 beta-ketoacyl-[acyl-carrier-protein] synthase family protein [Rubellimicrobium rubrum]